MRAANREPGLSQIFQNDNCLESKAHNYLEVKSLIDQVKDTYNNIQLDSYYQEIENILNQENYAIDKPFLKERISQTSKFLSEAIQELTRAKTTPTSTFISQPKGISLISPSFTPDSMVTPKNDPLKNINFEKLSSSKKPSILKSSRYSSGKRHREAGEVREEDSTRKSNIHVQLLDADLKEREDYTFDSYDEEQLPRTTKVTVIETENTKRRELETKKEAKNTTEKIKPAKDRKDTTTVSKPAYEPKPTTDVFLNNRISNPGLWLVESYPLGAIIPTCLASVSESEVAVGTASGQVIISAMGTARTIQIGAAPVTGLRARGRLLAVSLDCPAQNLCLLDVDFPDDLMFLQGHSRAVTSVAWSDCGRHFLSAGKDGKLNLWHWDPLSLAKSLKVSNLPLNSVACLAKSDLVAVGGDDGCIKVFSITGDALVYKNTLQDSSAILKLDCFFQNTKFVASANLLGEIKIWDLTSGE